MSEQAAAPAPAAPVEAARPVPEQAAVVAAALPARPFEPDAVLPVTAMPPPPAQPVEQMAAQAAPSAPPREPDAAPAVPAIAAAMVRLAPAPEWAVAGDVPLTPPPEVAALPSAPAVPSAVPPGPTPAAELAVGVSAEMARTILPGVDAQQVVSTMQLVQQMSLLVHDMHGESLRYRTEVTELTGAVQEKAANLEERLKRAEARTASGSGAETGCGGRASRLSPAMRGTAASCARRLRRPAPCGVTTCRRARPMRWCCPTATPARSRRLGCWSSWATRCPASGVSAPSCRAAGRGSCRPIMERSGNDG